MNARRSLQRHSGSTSYNQGFTLIEVLVVVAIIALLISILLPSLSRARDQARLSVCITNTKTLATASWAYATANRGRFPGAGRECDWAGKNNYDGRNTLNRTPIDGTLFRYLGKNSHAVQCPNDPLKSRVIQYANSSSLYHSYQINALLGGAKPEMVAGSHTRTELFHLDDHRTNMRPLTGAILFIEALYWPHPGPAVRSDYYTQHNPTWWLDNGSAANRHLKNAGDMGSTAVAWHDGSAGSIRYPGVPEAAYATEAAFESIARPNMWKWFHSKGTCIRTSGGKWVNTRDFNPNVEYYGWLDRAPASSLPH